jgi:hypothetical protein
MNDTFRFSPQKTTTKTSSSSSSFSDLNVICFFQEKVAFWGQKKKEKKTEKVRIKLSLCLSARINAPPESGGVFFSVFSQQPREEDTTEETFGNTISISIIIIQNGNDDENHRKRWNANAVKNRATPGAFR